MSGAEPDPYPLDELLRLARAAVVAAVDGFPSPPPPHGLHPDAEPSADAFVTLTEHGRLRGCVGTLDAGMPVGEAVVRAAGLAATRDPRFRPVDAGELERLEIEVSVLTTPRPLADPADFVPGRDGIIVEARGRRALLLPQVATELGWGATEMLDAVCEKAGLPSHQWREPGTRLLVFEALRAAGPMVVAPASPVT